MCCTEVSANFCSARNPFTACAPSLKTPDAVCRRTSSLKDSKNGTLDINYQSGGTGKYITNGKAIDITWTRASASSKTQYYDENGKEIILNPGKTWVEIVENSRASQNVIYHTAEEFQK